MQLDIIPTKTFDRKEWSVVLNLGKPLTLPDGTPLGQHCSGLFKDFPFNGENLVVIPVGENFDDVPQDLVDHVRKHWTPVYDIFPFDIFKGQDFYRSPKTKLGDLELNFWYCGPDFNCGIHNKHPFFEFHTQVLGHGEMQMFKTDKPETIYHREILSPGQSHRPFCNEKHEYPYHCYKSRTGCVWLAVESPTPVTPVVAYWKK